MRLPVPTLPDKPPHKAPCNRCGMCCHVEICWIGLKALRRDLADCAGPCPFLVINAAGTATACDLVLTEARERMGTKIRDALGIGTHCDSQDPNE